jgi:hypothetical protein
MPPHVHHGLRGLSPGCGWSVTDFWGWDAHEARLCCPNEVDGVYGYGVPGAALKLYSTNYSDHGHHGDPPLSGKNPQGKAGNRTQDLMISSQKRWPLDHEAGLTSWYRHCKLSRICALFKAYNGKRAWKPIGDRLKRPHYRSRVDNEWKISSRRQRTDIGKYSFVNRTIQLWNQLPAVVLGNLPCKQITFKKRVRKTVIELN